jgi:hypothetical protein
MIIDLSPTGGGVVTPVPSATVNDIVLFAPSGQIKDSNVQITTIADNTNGTVPTSKAMNTAIGTAVVGSLKIQGNWDASTNTPTLADGTGIPGHAYIVTVKGTQNLGHGETEYNVADIVYYGVNLQWNDIPCGNDVLSVNLLTGAITIQVGAVDTVTKSANGLVIDTTGGTLNLYLQTADATHAGLVSTGAQSIAGVKTFTSSPVVPAIKTASGAFATTTQSATLTANRTVTTPDADSNTVQPKATRTANRFLTHIPSTGLQTDAVIAPADVPVDNVTIVTNPTTSLLESRCLSDFLAASINTPTFTAGEKYVLLPSTIQGQVQYDIVFNAGYQVGALNYGLIAVSFLIDFNSAVTYAKVTIDVLSVGTSGIPLSRSQLDDLFTFSAHLVSTSTTINGATVSGVIYTIALNTTFPCTGTVNSVTAHVSSNSSAAYSAAMGSRKDAMLGIVGTALDSYTQTTVGYRVTATNTSPAFIGTPTAPTAALATNTTQLATTAFVIANTPASSTGSWTPTDASGAGLVFTVASATYVKVGKMIQISASVTFPTTASSATARLTLPFSVAAGAVAVGLTGFQTSGAAVLTITNGSQSNFVFYKGDGSSATNAFLSGKQLIFALTYQIA